MAGLSTSPNTQTRSCGEEAVKLLSQSIKQVADPFRIRMKFRGSTSNKKMPPQISLSKHNSAPFRTGRMQDKYLSAVELVQKYGAENLFLNPDVRQLGIDSQYIILVSSESDERPICDGIALRRFKLDHLHKAQDLSRRVFPEDRADLELSRVAHNRPYYQIDGNGDAIIASEYWVAVDEREQDRVVGVLGICYHSSDYKDAAWGDWAAVDQEYHGCR
jgi:hypothetical protein